MIEMGVGDHHGGDLPRQKRKRPPIALLQGLVSLVQAAVHEQPPPAPGELGTAAGDTAAGTMKCDGCHDLDLSLTCEPSLRPERADRSPEVRRHGSCSVLQRLGN